jgi:hypothetical protein
MKPPKPIDIKAVSEFIEIDETMASGLRWKKAPKYNSQVLGRQAGCPHKGGYYVFGLNHRHYLAHRVIMVLSCGYDRPDMEVDHIDGDVSNNSPSNLRWADRKLQTQNRRSKGMPYASWHKRLKKWQCRATVDGKRLHNGYYDTEAEASAAGVLRFGPRR